MTAAGDPAAFDSDYETVAAVKARRDRLDAAITEMAAGSEFSPVIRRLGCLRGIGTLTGFAFAVEIGDWHRFTGASIGVVRRAHPGRILLRAVRTQGPITKTGNGHVRRLLVEAAWHHRPATTPARPCGNAGIWHRRRPRARRPGQPAAAPPVGTFIERRKRHTVATVAVARELAGWCWSLAVLDAD